MAALRNPVELSYPERVLSQIRYWRGIRLDFPNRKDEAMRNIDNLLDELARDGSETR